MKQKSISKIIVAVTVVAFISCSETIETIKEDTTPTPEVKVAEVKETKDAVENNIPEESITPSNGTYTNNDGGTVIISNLSSEGFDFSFTHTDPKVDEFPDCIAIEYDESVLFDKNDNLTAKNDIEDSFKFNKAGFHFEPSMEMVGMDCMRIFSLDFVKTK